MSTKHDINNALMIALYYAEKLEKALGESENPKAHKYQKKLKAAYEKIRDVNNRKAPDSTAN